MTIVSELHSQGNDSSKIWIPRQDALNVLAKADSLSVYKLIVKNKQSDIDTLIARISGLKNIESALQQKDNNNLKIIKEKDDQKHLLEEQKSILSKQLRKEKRKRRWMSFVGLVGMAGAFWLGTNL